MISWEISKDTFFYRAPLGHCFFISWGLEAVVHQPESGSEYLAISSKVGLFREGYSE